MTQLTSVIKDIPYNIRKTEFSEAHFHIIVHVIMSVLGFEPVSEKETSDGRIDLTIRLSGIVYIYSSLNIQMKTNLVLKQHCNR